VLTILSLYIISYLRFYSVDSTLFNLIQILNSHNRRLKRSKIPNDPPLRLQAQVRLHPVGPGRAHPLPRMEQKPHLRRHRVKPTSRNHQSSVLYSLRVVFTLHSLHELGLAGDVEVVAAGGYTRGDDGRPVAAEGADAVEEDARAVAKRPEGGGVGGVGGEDGDGRWRIGPGGPVESLGQFGGVAACYGDGVEIGEEF